MKKPNLFDYATSELSQDAFICWLLKWSNPEYIEVSKELHLCGIEILKAFFNKHNKEFPKTIESVEVIKQDKNIDVLCIVNGLYPIIIEDKTTTVEHSNQLAKYYEDIKNRAYDLDKIIRIYFKTYDQSDYDSIKKEGYEIFNRKDLLEVLNNYEIDNDIYNDFKDRMNQIQADVDSYKILPISEWNWNSWIGFYMELQQILGDGSWGYVANQRGGFLGLWWNFIEKQEYTIHLQIETEKGEKVKENGEETFGAKLCFKIRVDEESKRADYRWSIYSYISEEAKKYNLLVKKPDRFGNGLYMTVAILDTEFRKNNNGVVDMTSTGKYLKEVMNFVNQISTEINIQHSYYMKKLIILNFFFYARFFLAKALRTKYNCMVYVK